MFQKKPVAVKSRLLVSAAVLVIGAAVSGQAQAGCGSAAPNSVIAGPENGTCNLVNGQSLTVNNGASLTVTDSNAVLHDSPTHSASPVFGNIINNGSINASMTGAGSNDAEQAGVWLYGSSSYPVAITNIHNGSTGQINTVLNNSAVAYGNVDITAAGIWLRRTDFSQIFNSNIINASVVTVGADTEAYVYGIHVRSSSGSASSIIRNNASGQINISADVTGTGSGSGSYVEASAIQLESSDASSVENLGTITVSGDLTDNHNFNSPNFRGIMVDDGAEVSNDVLNSGTIDIDISTTGDNGEVYARAMDVRDGSSVGGNYVNTNTITVDIISRAEEANAAGMKLDDSIVDGNMHNDGDITVIVNNQNHLSGSHFAIANGMHVESGSIVRNSIINDGTITVGARAMDFGHRLFAYGINVEQSTITTSLINNGSITDDSGTTNNPVGIRVFDTLIGTDPLVIAIHNTSDGRIAGRNGILIESGAGPTAITGNVVNDGTIAVFGNGLRFLGADTTLTGNIINNHEFKGTPTNMADNGIVVDGARIKGSITNNHSIEAFGNAIAIDNNGVVEGHIVLADGTTTTGLGAGISVKNGAAVDGAITNGGAISSNRDAGILVDGATVTGGIANNGSIDGAEGYAFSVINGANVGGIDNNGTISSMDMSGLYINEANVGTIENRAGKSIGGSYYAVEILDPVSSIVFDNFGELHGNLRIDTTTLNLEDGTVAGGAIDGFGGVVNIKTNFGTDADYGKDTAALDEINIFAGKTFTPGQSNVFATNNFNNNNANGTLSILGNNTVTVEGNYNQSHVDSVLRIQAASVSDYGKLNVTGNATFAAGTVIFVDVNAAASFASGSQLANVVTVGGLLSASTFKVQDNSHLFDFTARIEGQTVDLLLGDGESASGSAQGQSGNGAIQGAAAVIDSIIAQNPTGDMGDVVKAFGLLGSGEEVSDAIRQTIPTLTGGSTSAVMQTMGTTSQIVQARQEQNTGLSSGDDFIAGGNFWLKPFGTLSDQGMDDGIIGFGAKTYGVVAGADGVASDNLRLGAAVAYAYTDVKSDDSRNKLDIDTYQATVYGSYSISPKTEASFQLDAGLNKNDSRRIIKFGGLNRMASGDFNGYSTHIATGVGHVYDVGNSTTLTPSVRLDYSLIHNESYTETGAGGLSLKVKSQTSDQFIPSVAAKVNHEFGNGLSATANAGVGYDVLNDRNAVTASYVGGGAAFVTEGLEPSPWVVRTGAGLTYNAGSYDLTVRYDREDRGEFDGQTASLKLRMPF